jgi:putative oxidoreductase
MRDSTIIASPETSSVMKSPGGRMGKSEWPEIGILVLRITVGGLLLFHGIGKIAHGVEMMKPLLTANGLPDFLIYGVYIAEVIAPLMLILGIGVRLAGLAIIVDMIMAIILVRQQDILVVGRGGGWAIEIEAFYLLTAVALCFIGPGKYRIKF